MPRTCADRLRRGESVPCLIRVDATRPLPEVPDAVHSLMMAFSNGAGTNGHETATGRPARHRRSRSRSRAIGRSNLSNTVRPAKRSG